MWKKPNPVRDKIFATADLMRKQGIAPTTLNIRAKLGGSQTTVSKYLREWRELYDCEEDFSPRKMQKQLKEQQEINEQLTAQLLNLSAQNADQSIVIINLQSRILELETRLAEREQASQEKINNLTLVNQAAGELFKNSVEMLALQLSAVNEQAIRKVQEAGYHFDERTLEAKLEVRELRDQLAIKDKELKRFKDIEGAKLPIYTKNQ